MQTFIEKYLNKNFTVKRHERKNCIFYKSSDELAYPVDFIDELKTVLSISDEDVVKITIKWGLKTYGKRLKQYWAIIKPNPDWEGIAMPLVRRVFSRLVSDDIVPVQPMGGPTGQLFYYDYPATASTNTVAIQHIRVEPEMGDGELLQDQILINR